MTHDVFISHSTKDKAFANAICAALEDKGLSCWIAPRNIKPGEEWPVAIVNAVTSSRAMILVFSENANQSKDVAKETLMAINKGIEIYPLRIDDAEPSGKIQYYLADRTWFDAKDKAIPDLNQELLNALGPILSEKETHRKELVDKPGGSEEIAVQPPVRKRLDLRALIRDRKKILFPVSGMLALALVGFLSFQLMPRAEPPMINNVEAGEHSSFVLMGNGEIYAFGDHLHGQLGLGEGDQFSIPHKLELSEPVRAVSTGKSHTLFMLEDGSILAAGSNTFGQLGLEDRSVQRLFLPELIPDLEEVKAVSSGEFHSLVLLENKNLMSFGRKTDGQLGHSGAGAEGFSLDFEKMIAPPEAIESLIGANIKAISAGYGFSLVLLDSGEVYTFGTNSSGQLGQGSREIIREPEKIDVLTGAVAIAAGISHSLVLLENGDLYTFGRGLEGQLGYGDRETSFFPKRVDGPAEIAAIAAGGAHSLILTKDGHVYSFGSGEYGALGHGDQEDLLMPTRIETLENVRSIAAGKDHSIVLTDEDLVFTFGRNQSGQLGLGDYQNRFEPTAIAIFDQSPFSAEEPELIAAPEEDYYIIDYEKGTIPLSSLPIGARVVDPGWEWEYRRGINYSDQDQDGNPTPAGETKPVTWLVVAIDHYDLAESHVTLLSEELIGLFTFDNSTNRGWEYGDGRYGNPHWGRSGTPNASLGLRPWLNSTGIHSGEGFYRAFSEKFNNALLTTTLPNREGQSAAYSTRDKVFIPSSTELGDIEHFNTFPIGVVYPYFLEAENSVRLARLGGEAVRYWIRSPYHVDMAGFINLEGVFNNSTAHLVYGVRPVVNLKSDTLVSEASD